MGGSWKVFISYSELHLVTVAGCAALIAAIAMWGCRLRGTVAESTMRKALATSTAGFWVVYNSWWNWHGIDLYSGLPLHVCDLNGIIAPLALLTANRWLRATLYFWAATLTIQAFIQPTLTIGPAFADYWMFWISHTMILACAVYDLTVSGFRPDWSDLRRASLVSIAYLAVVIPVNLWLGANYGFVGNPPPGRKLPPIVEAFGPWPGRLVFIVGLAMLGFLLALLPWLIGAARRELKRDELTAEQP